MVVALGTEGDGQAATGDMLRLSGLNAECELNWSVFGDARRDDVEGGVGAG